MSKPKKEKKPETTGEMVRSFLIAVAIALVFRSLAYEPFHIPSGSMLSTLYEGDYVFVSKLSYGYSRYSFPLGMDLFEGRKLFTEPKRGDIVVFRNPQAPRVDYIKRLIGMPGDTIQVKQGRLYINDEAVQVTRRDDVELPDGFGGMRKIRRYDETLPGGVTHTLLDSSDGNRKCVEAEKPKDENDIRESYCIRYFDSDNTDRYTVPEGHYFMMGDNRDNSEDSRYSPALGSPMGPGFVPVENLVGRADIVFVSFKGGVPIWQVWNWWKGLRNDRWFTNLRN